MRVRFWGTRGSLPKPGPTTLRYGGNTSCVEVRADDGTLVVLDCGTGIHELGRALTASGRAPPRGHLLIGHTHWDHIQGFPFFAPLFEDHGQWGVYAPGGRDRPIEATLGAQMSYDYHPVTLKALAASVRFHDLTEGHFDAGGIRVTTQYLNHPALTLGYRLEADGVVLVYATDHEPHSLHPRQAPPAAEPVHHEDRRHVRFLEGADLLVHDAQYVLDEFPEKAGWGHCPVERSVDYALRSGARRLALFHHDPDRDDDRVDRLEELARRRVGEVAGAALEVFAAREGLSIPLARREPSTRRPIGPQETALVAERGRPGPVTVLVVEDDPDMARLVRVTLQADGVRTVGAGDGETALKLAREERPNLILLDMQIPVQSGLAVCRRLREERDPHLRDVPILILTGTLLAEEDLVRAFRAGATDYLTKPFKPTLLRSRVRGWLLRGRPA